MPLRRVLLFRSGPEITRNVTKRSLWPYIDAGERGTGQYGRPKHLGRRHFKGSAPFVNRLPLPGVLLVMVITAREITIGKGHSSTAHCRANYAATQGQLHRGL